MDAAGIIVGTDGLPVLLKGITWPGFDSGTMLNNLQARLISWHQLKSNLHCISSFCLTATTCLAVTPGLQAHTVHS